MTIVYLVGIIILMQLFNLQIINGSEYRENSNTKLTREAEIEAARGSIMDRNGNVFVSTEMHFSLEMYKSKSSDEQLNKSILVMTNILESNGDGYVDTFPIIIDPFEYCFDSEEELKDWKKKNGIPETASAEEAFYLFKDKYNIKEEEKKQIRQILAIRYAISTIGYSTTRSIEISKEISRNSAVQLQENSEDLTGVNVIVEPIRIYHTGSLASHIIGYMGRIDEDDYKKLEESGDNHKYDVDDKVGKYGIENVFEKYLRGNDGTKQIDMSVDGTVTGEYTTQEAIGGSNIILTIDSSLQAITENALRANVEKIRAGGFGEPYPAEGGSCVVANCKTGEILAMASYPDFEPELFYNGISQEKYNEYNDENSFKPLINRSVQGTYPPGSLYKMVTATGALETGAVSVSERINDNGPYHASDDENVANPACWYYNEYGHGHGRLNIVQALQKSCNYYFFEASNRIGIDTLVNYANYFGLGKKTGIELSEKEGLVAGPAATTDVWSARYTCSASIGQSYNIFTPVQMVRYISMIANGGHPLNLTIIKNIINSDGTQLDRNELNNFINSSLDKKLENTEDRNISETTINAIHEGMNRVAEEEGGTAYNIFRDFPIEIGGKTGSAELTNDKNSKDVIAWFAGFAPYNDPEIAIVVMVEKGGHGSYTAEVVRDIMQEYFGMNVEEVHEDMSAESESEAFR